jgi:hypothetical protein
LYADATSHYLAKRDPAEIDPEFRALEAEVLQFVAEHGPEAVIALQATRATVASELMWDAMMSSPANFRKYAQTWRSLSNASVRAWRELRVPESPEDLASARSEALEVLENQS